MQNKIVISEIEREFIDLYKENRSMFEAKTSARATIAQLVTINGMKIPSDLPSAGK